MVLTIGICEEMDATRRDIDEEEKITSDGEKECEMTLEKEGHNEVKQSGKENKGKTAEGSEASRSEKESPIVKEKRTPIGGAKINTSKCKKVLEQEADGSVELQDSLGKGKKACKEEMKERLKEELYQERRKKEDLVKERIRLEKQNDKLIIKNNHLKRKQEKSSAQRGEYALKKIAEECRNYRRDNKGRWEQNEREDLKRAIENNRREFRETEYLMQQSMVVGRRGNNTQIVERLQPKLMNKCARREPRKPEIAALFSLRQRENENLRSLVARWETICRELKGRISEEDLVRSSIYAFSTKHPLFTMLFKVVNEVKMKELKRYQSEHIRMEEEQ
ncbi:uncharacterized protein LOC113304938 [Papaver somniferum]|uniref:uncharacterized protein LOC113304938 n=1 Tax=Papaver somniferum TaxID=3469 RepID=UPI000E7008DB|nr:uncharacterized protein LOC113304938 [Papaver somniferum]